MTQLHIGNHLQIHIAKISQSLKRSGKFYPTNSVSKMSYDNGPANNSRTNHSTIKVLPTTASIRQFRERKMTTVRGEFVTLCEDVMKGSSIFNDEDRISFVRSKLVPG